ncbi:MAG: hypothetical protein QNJ04_17410, partial [Desulfobacterales bacterium]|nr:hypothetical protein [Desulfobacterales bacterium]
EQIGERVSLHLRADERGFQPEIVRMGREIALNFPELARWRGLIFLQGEHNPTAGIEDFLKQAVAVVRKPPPVGFAVVYDMPRRSVHFQMMPQILDRLEFYLPHAAIVSVIGQRFYLPPQIVIKVNGPIAL